MAEVNIFSEKFTFNLESGESLPGFNLAYQTFGNLNADKSNVIWVIHALTGNSNPTEWWPGIVGKDKVINPDEHFIICANSLGSPYGSTNPVDVDPRTGQKYYHNFPSITNRDIVNAFIKLKNHLGIININTLLGASLGGQQALEWAIQDPLGISNLILIATNAKHSPFGIAFNESQRLAIEADQSWREYNDDAGKYGLRAARSIALLSYRTSLGYNLTQKDEAEKTDNFRASSYQRYQGEKLERRFNAFSYYLLTKIMDSHNIGRNRNGIIAALSRIRAKTKVIGIDSDLLFPVAEQKLISEHIKDAKYYEISSILGHDGFLTENAKVSEIISDLIYHKSDNIYLRVS
jgi:homoserine O-acetyltransferase